MKLQALSYIVGIFAAIASLVDAKAKFHNRVHITHKVVPGAYIAEFEPSTSSTHAFFAHFNRITSPNITVRSNFQSEYIQGVSFSVDGDHSLDSILEAPGIMNVWPITLIPAPATRKHPRENFSNERLNKPLSHGRESNFDTMHNLTGVTEVHENLKVFGKGIKVGVLDYGVYYTHPAFGVDGKPGCYKKPGCRFQYGHDLVGDDMSSDNPTPHPDDDPFENCSKESHGTHVAGIIGADASNIQGKFKPAFPFSGVAPQVTFGAYRIFGCKGDFTTNEVVGDAITLAAKDGMDIINLSLGGGPGWKEDFQNTVINRVSAGGHIIVGAIGNDGGQGLWVGSNPAIAEGVIGVASVDSQRMPMNVIKDDSGKIYSYLPAFNYSKPFPNIKAKIIVNNPKAFQQNSPDDGCKPLNYKANGTVIIFLEPFDCSSDLSCRNALAAGAVGCLVYEPVPGNIPTLGDPTIPSASTTLSNAMTIIDIVKSKPNTIFDFTDQQQLFTTDTAGAPSVFTSWAIDPELQIKPDIAGIGGNVYSTKSPFSSGGVGYGLNSGTSMSTPYLAGSLALYMSSKGGKADLALLKTRFQNAAHPTNSFNNPWYASVAQQGAGIVNVLDTIISKTVVTPSVLALNDTVNTKRSYDIVIKNEYSTAVDYVIKHEPAATVYSKNPATDMLLENPIESSEYALVSFSNKQIRIAAGESQKIIVGFTAPEASNPDRIPVFSGYITVQPNLHGAPSSRVTYAGLKGSWKDAPIFSKVNKLGGIVTNIHHEDFTPIKANEVINVTKIIYPTVVLATPTSLYFGEVYAASSIKGKQNKSLGYLFTKELGPLYLVYAGRNTESFGQSTNRYNFISWTGLVTDTKFGTKSSKLPPGEYKVRMSGLKHFGNPQNVSDYDVYESQVFKLVY